MNHQEYVSKWKIKESFKNKKIEYYLFGDPKHCGVVESIEVFLTNYSIVVAGDFGPLASSIAGRNFFYNHTPPVPPTEKRAYYASKFRESFIFEFSEEKAKKELKAWFKTIKEDGYLNDLTKEEKAIFREEKKDLLDADIYSQEVLDIKISEFLENALPSYVMEGREVDGEVFCSHQKTIFAALCRLRQILAETYIKNEEVGCV